MKNPKEKQLTLNNFDEFTIKLPTTKIYYVIEVHFVLFTSEKWIEFIFFLVDNLLGEVEFLENRLWQQCRGRDVNQVKSEIVRIAKVIGKVDNFFKVFFFDKIV